MYYQKCFPAFASAKKLVKTSRLLIMFPHTQLLEKEKNPIFFLWPENENNIFINVFLIF